MVFNLISWKSSLRRLNKDYEMAMKKKHVLDNLLETGRISQSTYEIFNKEFADAIAELERQQKDLLEKMNSKMKGLEEHIRTLEVLLANFEIQHVAGEISEEVYQREISLLSTGLEAARQELDAVKEAFNQLSSNISTPIKDVVVQETEVQTQENAEVVETESLEVSETLQSESPQEQENPQITEVAEATEEKVESEEKHET
jgi:chemotaxis protein CheY-P-specific phosphatase CheC